MAVRHEIEIEITPDGEVKLTVKGASGDECMDLTKVLEEELGLVTDRQKTSAYYETAVTVDDTISVGED